MSRDSGEAWRFTANFRLGRHWQEIGDFVRAHAAYLEAKALSKGKHRATLYNLAVVAIRLGLYDEAKATLKELAALDGLPMEPQDARSPRPALYPLVYQRALIEEYRGDYDIARQWSEPLARDALKDEGPVPLALRLPALTLHAGVLVELDHTRAAPRAADAMLGETQPSDRRPASSPRFVARLRRPIPPPAGAPAWPPVDDAVALVMYIKEKAGTDHRTRYNLACLCSRLARLVPDKAVQLAARAAQHAEPALLDAHLAAWAAHDPSLSTVSGTAKWEEMVERVTAPEPQRADADAVPHATPPAPDIRLDEQVRRERTADQALGVMDEIRVDDSTQAVLGVRQLREDAGSLSRRQFEIELASAVAAARDPGTAYRLPAASAGTAMALPFAIEEVFDERGASRFVVVGSDRLEDGTDITHWNGVPMEEAVALRAKHIGAPTAEARRARALATLTVRPARWLASFDEGDVTIRCPQEELSFAWQRVASRPPAPDGSPPWSVDPILDAIAGAEDVHSVRGTYLQSVPGVVHLGVATFRVEVDTLTAGLELALGTAPARPAVVLDLRGNPGGSVTAAIRLLELLCGVRIKYQVELRAGERTEHLVRPFDRRWAEAVSRARRAGRADPVVWIKTGRPRPRAAAERVVLLVDARCGGAAALAAQIFVNRGLGRVVSAAREPGLSAGLTAVAVHDRGEGIGGFTVTYGRIKGLKAAQPTLVQLPRLPRSAVGEDVLVSVAAKMAGRNPRRAR